MQPQHGGNLTWAAALAGCPPCDILDFSASINPFGPPEAVLLAIRQVEPNSLAAYPDPSYQRLCQQLGEHHQLDPAWILPGNGSAELLTWAARDLAKCQRVILPVPAFGDYQRALQGFSAQILPCPLPIAAAIQAESACLPLPLALDGLFGSSLANVAPDLQQWGILLNSPHNPTGQLWQRQSLLPLLSAFGLVVVDEAFMDFLPTSQSQSLVEWVPAHPNLVILRSLTKFYRLPGLRLGYAIAHPDRLRRWQAWRDPWPVNILAEQAALAALTDIAFQQQTWAWLPPARQQLQQGLARLPGVTPIPGAANFLLVKCATSVVKLQRHLLQQAHILIRDCQSFPELGDHYCRVAVRTEAENQRLLTALATHLPDHL